ncbi:hypothetical protein [uncultured Ramlibacter sp.]|uniref:hypothetical protein n=1 Tax=uncultured Ramlibacter sp. TaxID=260755 RepID=UPI00262C6834|nr:hypothetical protein [uncultured Ramlibacter sp.]
MKKLILVSALAMAAVGAHAAGTVGQAFNVTASLTSVCQTDNATPAAVAFGAYTAFGSAATPAPTSTISFKCTRGLTTPTATLSSGSGTIGGLAYTLAVAAGTKVAATGNNPDVYSYVVTGTMASGQAGDAAASTAAVSHTLTIAY